MLIGGLVHVIGYPHSFVLRAPRNIIRLLLCFLVILIQSWPLSRWAIRVLVLLPLGAMGILRNLSSWWVVGKSWFSERAVIVDLS